MDLKIKDKHKFIDLATYGSQARTEVRPDVYIGSERSTPFKEGDLLDANATYSLMQEAIGNNLNIKWFETNEEFKIELYAGNIGENDICFIKDIAAIYKNGDAIGWLDKSQLESVEAAYQQIQQSLISASMINNDYNEAQYEAIQEAGTYERNVLYLINEE